MEKPGLFWGVLYIAEDMGRFAFLVLDVAVPGLISRDWLREADLELAAVLYEGACESMD